MNKQQLPNMYYHGKSYVSHLFQIGVVRVGVLAIFFSMSLLLGCNDKAEQLPETAKIDRAKIERVAFDFHFSFFDEAFEPIELSIDETAYFYNLKAQGKVRVGDPVDNLSQEYGEPADKDLPPRGGEPPSLAYNKTCREAGVPIPPPFGRSTWTEIGSLPGEQIFSDSRFNPLFIWRYKSTNAPVGLCAATVRYQIGKMQDKNNKAANVQVVGIICQGKKTGNACFWASETNPFGKIIDGFELNGDTIPTYTTFTNQDGTKGTKPLKCTFCHLGSNAFIVHPGTVLDGIAEEPEKRYTPISKRNVDNTNKDDKWGNPPWKEAANVIAANDCRSCHAFAEVNKVWCRDLLQKAIGKTMPPADGGLTPKQQLPKFKNSLDVLKAECAKVGYDLKF